MRFRVDARTLSAILLALSVCLSPSHAQEPAPPNGEGPPRADEVLVIGRRDSDGVPEVDIDFPASRDILQPEEVQAIGARDLNDLVRHLPTISTRPYNGGEASAPSFGARGLPDDGLTEYLHVLINGVPANAGPYGWTAFSFMPLATERVYAVDNIRGGHTVRYSPNTVGGVLNFLTYPIPQEGELQMRQSFGNHGFASSFLTGGMTTVEGTGFRISTLDRHGDGYREGGDFEQQDFSADLRQDYQDGSWLATSLSWFRDEHAAPGGVSRIAFDADRWANSRPENRFKGFRGLLDVVYHKTLGEDWFEVFSATSVTERNLFAREDLGTSTVLNDWHDQTFFANLGVRGEHSLDWGGVKHTLHGGMRLHREWLPSYSIQTAPLGSSAFVPNTDSSFRLLALSAHLDDTFSPTPKLLVTAGFRTEYLPSVSGSDSVSAFTYEDQFFDVLPAAGLSYTFNPHLAAFLNYGEGFRAPQFWGFAFAANPQDALKFESGRSGELGLRFQDLGPLSGSVAAWQLDFDDYLVFDTGFYENVGRIASKGVDFGLNLEGEKITDALTGLRLEAALSIQDSTLQEGPFAGNDVPYAWNSKASWRASYEVPSGFLVSLGGIYVGDNFSDEANTTAESADGRLGVNSAVVLWDGQVSRRFAIQEHVSLQISVGAANLFDKEWEVHSRGGFFGAGLVSGAPRQAYATVFLEVL